MEAVNFLRFILPLLPAQLLVPGAGEVFQGITTAVVTVVFFRLQKIEADLKELRSFLFNHLEKRAEK